MNELSNGWTFRRFGQHALKARESAVNALHMAINDAIHAQKESGSRHKYTFGSTLMTRRFERIAEAFRDLPGAKLVRPVGSPNELVVFQKTLLYPFRYANEVGVPLSRARITKRKISGLITEMFQEFGPHADEGQLSFFDPPNEQAELKAFRDAATVLPEGTRLVPIAFAGNDRAGLLDACWGEARLRDTAGHLDWLPDCSEQLPISLPPPRSDAELG